MYWEYLCCIVALPSSFSLFSVVISSPATAFAFFSLSILPFPRESFAFQKEFGWGSLLAVRSHEPGRYSWSSASLTVCLHFAGCPGLGELLAKGEANTSNLYREVRTSKIKLGGSYTCFVLRGVQNTFMVRCGACKW